ncbi:MAG TPA: DUF3592 domain-containing protein [Anaerolineales bacterium]|nr:DUF3592 domain-containing protein [Anaerolineales bacterium]
MKKQYLKTFFIYFAAHTLIFLLYFLIRDTAAIVGSFFISPHALLQTEGKITYSNRYTKTVLLGGRGSGHGTTCHFVVAYTYTVQGNQYSSNRIHFLARDTLCNETVDYEAKYPRGKIVTLYYLKGFPRFSVLEPENRLTFSNYGYKVLTINLFFTFAEAYCFFMIGRKSYSSSGGKIQVSFAPIPNNQQRSRRKQSHPKQKAPRRKSHQ